MQQTVVDIRDDVFKREDEEKGDDEENENRVSRVLLSVLLPALFFVW